MDGTTSIDISEGGSSPIFVESAEPGGLGDVPRLIQVAGSSLSLTFVRATSCLPNFDSSRLLRTAAGKEVL